MRGERSMAPCWGRGLWARCLMLIMAVPQILAINVRMGSSVYGVVGESIRLWCSFSSDNPITELVNVDWTYRPQAGGSTVNIMHYNTKAFPITFGPFKDRVKWEGDVDRGDASILLEDLRLTDNGTLSCVVKNPPDVHGKVPQMKLTVTLKSLSFKFNTAILLSALVFIPSFLVFIILLIRMKKAIQRERSKNQRLQKSSIEDSQDCIYDENDTTPLHPDSSVDNPPGCCMRLCMKFVSDSDDY